MQIFHEDFEYKKANLPVFKLHNFLNKLKVIKLISYTGSTTLGWNLEPLEEQ
jgi:hypothetical protein